ncbi:DUF3298 domain-containing protein [Halalkalibacterium halodurans]|uniref:DUF3298 and DUF4163 domain-containing protein n=1 Tax=Halalkalibacterium halodurans TaxID=86665 RepID=UPI002E226B91|nr:DUF3298 domain-containing protein [Halalkalibacterium halodurans]
MNESILPVQIGTKHLIEKQADVYVPLVTGGTNAQVRKRINERIEQQVKTLLQKSGVSEPNTEITGGYEIKTNQRHVLSLTNSQYTYTQSAAHGMTYLRSLTFDTMTGKAYRLNELFKPGSPYQQLINEQIKQQIAERDMPLLAPFEGIAPNQFFYIADKALVIYFQLYDLMPYAYGFPYFPISVYSLASIVKEDGPLGRMMY